MFVYKRSGSGFAFSCNALDLILQKSIRHNHHKQNYERSLFEGIIATGLKTNKKPAFQPISGNFYQQWNTVLDDMEKRLVKLLLEDLEKVIETSETEITRRKDKKFPDYTDSERKSVREKHNRSEQNLEIEEIKSGKNLKRERESKHTDKQI